MNDELLDIITLISFVVGVINLDLNTEQNRKLDQHLQDQDAILKEQQNVMLEKVIEQNKEIISLLKELKKCIHALSKTQH